MGNVKKRPQKKNALDNKSKKSKPDKTTTTGQDEVTTLSNIRKLPENQAYEDVRQCRALKLTKVDAKPNIHDARKNTQENIDPWTNPVASTSGTCKKNKRKASNKKVHQSKRLKAEYNSEVDNDDNYSLLDTSEEETVRSEYEDKVLDAFNERNNVKGENTVEKHEDKIGKNQTKRTKELENQRNQYNKTSTQAKKVKVDDNYSGEQNSDSSEDICLSEYKKRNFDCIMTNQIETIPSEEIDINNIQNFIEIDENGEIMEYETCLWIENNSEINQNKIKNDEVDENVKNTIINENNSQKVETTLTEGNVSSKKFSVEHKEFTNMATAGQTGATEKTEKRKKITILSDIRNTSENKIVVDTKKLKRVEKTVDLFKSMINKYKENKQTECQMAELKLGLDLPGTAQNETAEVKKNTKKKQNQTEECKEVQKLDAPETIQNKTEESKEIEKSDSPQRKQNKTEESEEVEKSDSLETNQNKIKESEEVENLDSPETNQNKTEEREEVETSDLPKTDQNKTEECEEVEKLDSPEINQNKTEENEEVENLDLPETNQNNTEEREVEKSNSPKTDQNKTKESKEVEKLDLPKTSHNKNEESEEVENSDSPETNQNKNEESKEVEKLDLPETNQDKTEESDEVENSDSPETNQNKNEESKEVEKLDLPETNQDKTEESEEVENSDSPETNQNKNEESEEVENLEQPETDQNKTEESEEVENSDSPETNQNKNEERKEVETSDSRETNQNNTEKKKEIGKPDSPKTYQKKTEDDEEIGNCLHLSDANRNDAKEEESDYDTNSIVINQSVLVRYYIRAKWKYYVGFVEKIDVREQEIFYTVHFLKTIKKPNLKFVVTKYDRDTVPSTSIVKIIQLL
ncbi:TNF receptor-associated factor family protein DDB_G0272098-like, partial [Cydia pomonella]|uniref:TNF receptor-associated factor family protein DDB_G0272098-like n=1 Tax=Cydia pomonella TaxID=82600 RepID=UPI002ADE5C5F